MLGSDGQYYFIKTPHTVLSGNVSSCIKFGSHNTTAVMSLSQWRTFGWCKLPLLNLKFNTYRYRYIQHDVTTTYYPKINPNHKKSIKYGSKILIITRKSSSTQKNGGLRL